LRLIGIFFFLARRVSSTEEMPEQPGSRKQQAQAAAAARKMAISDALSTLALGQAHATLAYEPTAEHFERAKQVLRTTTTAVVSDSF
jgi:hypothetical protein